MYSIAKGMPPLPIEDAERAEHTRLRRRLLYGKWREDLHKRRYQLFPHVRAEAQGPVDLSGNTFRASCTALAVLYEEPPLVVPPAGSLDAEGVAAAMEAGGYWELMIRGQRDCIGLREWMVRVDSVPDPSAPLGHALVYRPVYPDQVHAEAMPSSPDTLALIREPVLRNYRGNMQWTWDEWSIKDLSYPYYRVLDDALRDISAEVNADTAEGDAYRWRDEDGSPVLPYALYHAERTGYLWDPWEWVELVEGTLNVGVYWSFWGHVVRNASWPQRYAVGVRVPMDTVEDERANSGILDRSRMAVRHRVVTDPSTVIMFESASEEAGGGQAMIGQWQPGADPQAMQDAISAYERRLANFAGLNPADFQRVDGDPRSGYAMKLTQDGQAKAQRRYLRSFRRGDLEAIRASAAVLARALDRPIPTRGYDVQHVLTGEPVEIEDQDTNDTEMGSVAADEAAETAESKAADAGVDSVQDTALNGAQVQAAADLIVKIGTGELPKAAVAVMLAEFFTLDPAVVDRMLASIEEGSIQPDVTPPPSTESQEG